MTHENILEERNKTHGAFTDNARVAQELKDVMLHTRNWDKLHPVHKEALHMTAHKIARILSGDFKHNDHWIDGGNYMHLPIKFNHGYMSLDEAEKRVVQ
jgi:hypothetical protein